MYAGNSVRERSINGTKRCVLVFRVSAIDQRQTNREKGSDRKPLI
jgi:hypothetical protein